MAAEWFLTDSGGAATWGLTDTPVADVAADAPTSVTGEPVSDTTSLITWMPAVSGGTPIGFEVEYEAPAGSTNWVVAAGAANPTGAGVASFAVTGQTAGMQVTPRVRALRTGFAASAWTTGSPFYLDELVGGGGEIPQASYGGSSAGILITSAGSGTGSETPPQASEGGSSAGVLITSAGNGVSSEVSPVYPDPSTVLLGIQYGPYGTDFTGTALGGGVIVGDGIVAELVDTAFIAEIQ